jgi:hypothetical protein
MLISKVFIVAVVRFSPLRFPPHLCMYPWNDAAILVSRRCDTVFFDASKSSDHIHRDTFQRDLRCLSSPNLVHRNIGTAATESFHSYLQCHADDLSERPGVVCRLCGPTTRAPRVCGGISQRERMLPQRTKTAVRVRLCDYHTGGGMAKSGRYSKSGGIHSIDNTHENRKNSVCKWSGPTRRSALQSLETDVRL